MITGYSKEPKRVPLLSGKYILAYDAYCKCPTCGRAFVCPTCIPAHKGGSQETMIKLLLHARCDDCVNKARVQEHSARLAPLKAEPPKQQMQNF